MPLDVYVHDAPAPFVSECRRLVSQLGHRIVGDPAAADVALAPMLRRVLTPAEYNAPRHGTLVFHPSLLPRRRGPDAVRWTVTERDPFSGVTWFWCDDGLDEGPVCEQQIVHVPAETTPRQFYDDVVRPAGMTALHRALDALAAGVVRRVAQDPAAATYESWHPSRAPR